MGSVNVGHLAKNRVIRDMSGNIIDWYNEANGGWIIKGRQVVNQDKFQEYLKIEQDKQEAATAITKQIDNDVPERIAAPSRVDDLEVKVNDMGSKLDAILTALNKK